MNAENAPLLFWCYATASRMRQGCLQADVPRINPPECCGRASRLYEVRAAPWSCCCCDRGVRREIRMARSLRADPLHQRHAAGGGQSAVAFIDLLQQPFCTVDVACIGQGLRLLQLRLHFPLA